MGESSTIEKYVDKSLKMLKCDYIDVMHIHWPFQKYLLSTYFELESLVKKGKIRSIGLCNINKRVYEEMLKDNIQIKPLVIQNEISPINTDEDNIKYFKENSILIEAYSPLARMRNNVKDSRILKELARKYEKNVPQIILKWHVQKGITPIFTSTKPERVKENLDIFDFNLTDDDIKKINALNENYKIFPISYGCPGF